MTQTTVYDATHYTRDYVTYAMRVHNPTDGAQSRNQHDTKCDARGSSDDVKSIRYGRLRRDALTSTE